MHSVADIRGTESGARYSRDPSKRPHLSKWTQPPRKLSNPLLREIFNHSTGRHRPANTFTDTIKTEHNLTRWIEQNEPENSQRMGNH
ncbi:hypothetical protein BC936DRAFT_139229 [Jimgerdemannia flammicorona]|uniref:Uncharacterized protein n=1 Tax=Jimgerdemannia flammicorona TaxID=994334 RepID=A0A433BAD0_9FUNG|nr:hypothetical protein BC936DRAFT_139229 [Jimgerdemannia flammicorona]